MIKFLLLSLLLIGTAFAQIESEKKVSESVPVTKSEEAKPYLLHKAVLELVFQYSTEFGIDPAQFKTKLEEKFQVHFENYKKRKLTEKFGKNYASELTEEQKKIFVDGLESNRNEEFINFAKLSQLLDSYAFKAIESDPGNPSSWTASIVMNLNRVRLERYNQRLLATDTKTYSKLLILTEINLIGLSWPDLGLDKEQSFSNVLMSSWHKWLTTNQPANVDEISMCTGGCVNEFFHWQQLAQEEGMQVPDNIINGLWLKVSYNLRKLSYSPGINEWQFEWDGSVVLLDANTKKIVSSQTILPENKIWRGLDQKGLNSAIASAMYRAPLDSFTKIVRKVQDTPRLNRLNRLEVQGHRHLGDVLILMELLRKEGASLHVEPQIDVFGQKEAELLCFYQGEEKSFTDLLSRLKELKSSQSYRLVNEFTGIHHVLKLVAE